MKTYAIRIFEGRGDILSPTLSDILKEIDQPFIFNWNILFLDGTPNPGYGEFLTDYKKKINNSENGILVSWGELKNLSEKFFQMYETIILGSKNAALLHRYKEEKEMYKTCDIVLELIDCAFWEVYVKDIKIIERFKKNFKDIELFDSDNDFQIKK